MPVFQIRTLYSDDHRVMDIIGETFDAIEALEITPNHWLIIGTPEAAQATFERLKAGLPRDVLKHDGTQQARSHQSGSVV